ncbi:MAG: hypothetical protein OEV49_00285 [candidate division Zixibacteria bacterium]|nr:hypothetical protein [candidate division Zixibacteria bacterium]MDH3939062.1 hypothetical protein [candidate division Zixibacteria bacterium]MDH4032496.1 hypothetical protein [candidate division Zixibacteria bacterium]
MHDFRSSHRIVTEDLEAQRVWARRQARSLLFQGALWLVGAIIIAYVSSEINLPLLLLAAGMALIPFLVKSLRALHLYVKYSK